MEFESNLKKAYLQAYKIACERLRQRDPEEIGLNSNAVYDKANNEIIIKYFNEDFAVSCSTGNVARKTPGDEVTTTVKVLILHYLINARAKPLSGNLISFKEIPGGGAIYYQTFYKRAVAPLIKTFEKDPEALWEAAEKLGGKREKFGHASATIKVFPLVPVTYVVWQGDEEVPSSGTILFDDTVTNFLPTEDIVLAASFGAYELMRLARR